MDIASVDLARAELPRLGAALTSFELQHPGAPVPPELLRAMAAACRKLIQAIGDYVINDETTNSSPPWAAGETA